MTKIRISPQAVELFDTFRSLEAPNQPAEAYLFIAPCEQDPSGQWYAHIAQDAAEHIEQQLAKGGRKGTAEGYLMSFIQQLAIKKLLSKLIEPVETRARRLASTEMKDYPINAETVAIVKAFAPMTQFPLEAIKGNAQEGYYAQVPSGAMEEFRPSVNGQPGSDDETIRLMVKHAYSQVMGKKGNA